MGYYLMTEQLKSRLNVGGAIDQWLGTYEEEREVIIKWINIFSDKDGYHVLFIESYDEGDEDFVDVVSFSAVDPDGTYGVLNTFDTSEEVIKFVMEEYGASADKFVAGGMIQEEYIKYLSTRG